MIFNGKVIYWEKLRDDQKKHVLLRPIISQSNHIKDEVQNIILNIRDCGDKALRKYTKEFDKIILNNFQVSQKRIDASENMINQTFKDAVSRAYKNINCFHMHQKLQSIDIETQPGIRCQQIILPIESVGLYVPGGSAPLLSTALMLAIPANIAGCKNIILCSPPPIVNEILYIAKICGVTSVFEMGGAQAIAALAFGTDTIPKVDKIFGPGNVYVTESKIQLNQLLSNFSIDMSAGPSELLIIADSGANPVFIAADLLSQAEHGLDSQVILLTPSENIIKQVVIEINKQILSLSRSDIILKSLQHSRFIVTHDLLECINISNIYAPEHLIIQTENPRLLLSNIVNAGSIFLGCWSPEAIGDYASGTNHVLPTYGSAVSSSVLGVMDFQKRINVQELTYSGLKNIFDTVQCLTLSEKLDAHYYAVALRINSIRKKYGKLF